MWPRSRERGIAPVDAGHLAATKFASMWPRSRERGIECELTVSIVRLPASMWPRSRERGIVKAKDRELAAMAAASMWPR